MTPSLTRWCLALACAAPAVHAADWPMLSGSEDGRPEQAIEPYGYLQVLVESTPLAAPVTGLQAPELAAFEGEHHALNEEAPLSLSIRRARLGLRGTIPHTDRRVTYRFSMEAGQNDITRDEGITLVDASVSAKVFPGLRLLVGQFKLPMMDETSESIPQTGAMAALSPAALLLLEQPVSDGRFVGQAFGFRDVGVQAFDRLALDHVELAYALMVSQGRFNSLDHDGRFDVTGRVQLAWLRDQEHPFNPRRDEVALAVWSQHGEREADDAMVPRVREGFAVHASGLHTRSRFELVHAFGMILLDPEHPFVDQPVRLADVGEAWGYAAQFTAEPVHGIDVTAQLSELYRLPGDVRGSVLRDVVVGVEWWPSEKVRLQLEYDARAVLLPKTASVDAQTIANAVADIVLAQFTVML